MMGRHFGRKDAIKDARRAATLVRSSAHGAAVASTDADTVDGFDAAATPTANTLLALDGYAEFPTAALKTGCGINVDGSGCFFPFAVRNVDSSASVLWATGDNLQIAPAGDVVFDPTGNDLLPQTGYDLNIGSLSHKFLTLHAAELWVETLVAQDTIATIGGRVIVSPTTYLTVDCAASDATFTVKHNEMTDGDVAVMSASGHIEFFDIQTAACTVADGYEYRIGRDLDGTGANDWYAGDAVVNTGAAGDGFIDLYSVHGITASATTTGPTIVGNVRSSSTYNDWSALWAIGNLDGLYGYGSTTYGVGLGAYAAGSPNVTVDATNGLRFRIHDQTPTIQMNNSGACIANVLQMPGASAAISVGANPPTSKTSGTGLWLCASGLYALGSGTEHVRVDCGDGVLYAGAGAVSLSASGLKIDSGTGDTNKVKWYDGDTNVAWLVSYLASGHPYMDLEVESASAAKIAAIQITADTTAIANQDCTLLLRSGMTGYSASMMMGTEDYYRLAIANNIVDVRNADFYVIAGDGMGGDARIEGGLYVGSTGTNPSQGTITTTAGITAGALITANQDVRIGGGLYVGGTGTDPSDDNVLLDGFIRFMAEGTGYTPDANQAVLYIRDNGGKTELCVKFSDGAAHTLATQA